MHRLTTTMRCAALIGALALVTNEQSFAAFQRTVVFSTVSNSQMNQLAIQGTLNTLAQGLNIVPFDNSSSVEVCGTLTANLLLETLPQGGVRLMGVDFVESNFTQTGMNLSYKVPGTSRTVTFATSDVEFSLNMPGIVDQSGFAPLAASLSGGVSEIVQNKGTAEISITDRPSKTQYLTEYPVVGAHTGSPLLEDFSIDPLGGIDYSIDLQLPIDFQQLLFSKVGLPVSLNYSGTLQLSGSFAVPEPAGALLAVSAMMLLCVRGWATRKSRGEA